MTQKSSFLLPSLSLYNVLVTGVNQFTLIAMT
ncbi:MAG: hypothetical protein ACI8RD_009582, partial [Bacillariaceae sp.]